MTPEESRALKDLAELNGVHTEYNDVAGRQVEATASSLKAVLSALGVSVSSDARLTQILHAERGKVWRHALEPVQTAWEGRLGSLSVRLPEKVWRSSFQLAIHLDSGREISIPLPRARVSERAQWDGQRFERRTLEFRSRLPLGYHRLVLETAAGRSQSLILSAPEKTYSPKSAARSWGLFSPLYALREENGWGSGNFTDLERLLEWESQQGASLVSTLPLLPAFLDEPFEPSPYSPVSRLFWNEFYVDVERTAEFKSSRRAQALVASPAFRRRLDALRTTDVVQYREGMVLKREILEVLANSFFARDSVRRSEFKRFVKEHRAVESYAQFRAVVDRRREGWSQWPERMRRGELRPGDYDEAVARYYLYAQWIAHEQMRALAEAGERSGVALYLDMPLGVHSDGFDTWCEQGLFALNASGGAPPDAVYTKGQDWGFAPLHPQRSREQGYRYMIAYLRHHLELAKMLRLDHVMGVHRLFWVPKGLPASAGVYVSYPFQEIYAVLSLESHRHQSVVVGENLGTVPPAVNSNMKRHGVRQMFVVQYELRPDPQRPLRPVPRQAVASLNTHDMFPFAAFWEDVDIADRHDLGLMKSDEVASEKEQRRLMREALVRLLRRGKLLKGRDEKDGLSAILALLARSSVEFVLVNLEDLWRETASQNVPGTTGERVNWRRKARLTLEQLRHDPDVNATLRALARLRPKRRRR